MDGAGPPRPPGFRPAPCSRRTRHAPASSREALQAVGEISRGGEACGMQFRIAAGQPAAIGIVRRRFVGERREGQDLGAGAGAMHRSHADRQS